jgi:hypothetical protein
MPHRVIAAALLGSLLCAAPRQAFAGDPPALPAPAAAPDAAPAWPAELKHRNARYASLTRVDDPSGDVHERLIAHMQMNRVTDRVGDLEEVRRKRTAGAVPPLAVKDALVMRDQDVDGDGNEVVLASIRHSRRHAETRRFRDLSGDSTELTVYKRDLKRIRLENEDRVIGIGDGMQSATRHDFIDRRIDREARETGDTMGEDPRAEEREFDQADRALQREEEHGSSLKPGAEDFGDVDDVGLGEIDGGLGVDDPLDDIAEDSDARMEEKQLERQTEAQLEQEEAGAGGTP